jgi:hypothetical protein
VEKDEKFWIAACMMTVFHSPTRNDELTGLFRRAYGEKPPVHGVNEWQECLSGDLHLFFEANLPSPRSYKEWLSDNLPRRQVIPHILDSAHQKKTLEGATNVDALILNSGTGFSVLIEAKVLSDVSHGVVYDLMRNQIARNIDVMLEKNLGLCDPLDKRDPQKSLFLLVTPRLFKDYPTTRFYGYKFNEYKNNPGSLAQDLPHRSNCDWAGQSKRLGWLTWEDFREVNSNCCRWLG